VHKNFNVSSRANSDEPITFSMKGRDFKVKRAVPGGWLLDVIAAPDTTTQVRSFIDFLDKIMDRDSAHVFAEAMHDEENPIELADIIDLANWLIEDVYTGFPTKQSSTSDNGSSSPGQTSTVDASS
jgi:hypothetical protein